MKIVRVILDLIKDSADEYLTSMKDFIDEVSRKIYSFIIILVIGLVALCFSFGAFMVKLGDSIDIFNTIVWTNSMTLYSLTFFSSLILLHYNINRKNKFREATLDSEIKDLIKKYDKKSSHKRRK